ncbi:MAG: cytochrome C oxidase subunit IV family protein [Pseudomonas sp.]|uniref:Membrane protein NirP n=2 Tax=Stutzerimonas TaxID=2901164 RepID=A0A8E2QIR5_9GAMM|nr:MULTISPECIES: cytochrome C oxidase subunit IV family protein [Pseudomonadaceae]EIK54327.1 membrane protein NirP [Stutzerimonas stutzeri TS44]MBV2207838.1 cytochrome C oxidase subunit IV family protein [Pseudomonas sp.]EKM97428.1 membrane protein NirP [Stutzerimonas degradans]EKM97659.1 membrane protein NirP [Stutzerimonas degradans]MCF6753644.1 cytochrome C oxidase subunit IV family protein [Stutzerimonas stutzeri]
MSASKVLVGCWLGLALLSITTVLLGSAGSTLLLGGTILLVALGKAWLITEGFMELRHAPRLWRLLLLAWPLLIALIVILLMLRGN